MTVTEMENRLSQLRTGFDIAIERTLREKAPKAGPLLGRSGWQPRHTERRTCLADFYTKRRAKEVPAQ